MIDRQWIGAELPPAPLTLERGRLRFFAKAIGELDPIYRDLAAAQAAGHPDLPAPPTFLFAAELDADAAFWLVERLGVPLASILHGEQSFRYHRIVHAGETMTVRTRIADIYGKRDGELEFVVLESTAADAAGQPVAELRSVWVVRHAAPPGPAVAEGPADGPVPGARSGEAPRAPDIRAGGLIGDSPRPTPPGEAPRPVALALGERLPPLAYPPLSRQTLALFAGASGDHNPIHLDTDFARAAGHPDVFAQGMLGMARLARLLTGAVPQARLRSLAVRFTAVTHVGDALRCDGEVIERLVADGEACARLALTARTADGTVTLRGEAVIALPSVA